MRSASLELAAGGEEELAARATFVLARGGEAVAADVARLVPAFSGLLQDDWFVTGEEHSGFPRR